VLLFLKNSFKIHTIGAFMEKQEETSDEFRYQDNENLDNGGRISSALDDKGAYYFSWTKTILVTLAAFSFVVFSLSFLFQIGKKSLLSTSAQTENSSTTGQVNLAAVSDSSTVMQAQLRAAIQDSANQQVGQLRSSDDAAVKSNLNSSKQRVIKRIKKEPKSRAVSAKSNKSISKKKPMATKNLAYKVIVGTFSSKDNARKLIQKLKSKKISSFMWVSKQVSQTFYKVQVGAFPSRKEAEAFRVKISKKGFQSYIFQKK